jgi:ComF family protein
MLWKHARVPLRAFIDFLFPRSENAERLSALPVTDLAAAENTEELPAGVFATLRYRDELVRTMIWEIKYKGNQELAERAARTLHDELLGHFAESLMVEPETVVLVPVPSTRRKKRERGWNQAELLAECLRALSPALYICTPHAVRKIRETTEQSKTRSKRERLDNLKGAFALIEPGKLAGKTVVVIDDVVTTGATFAELKRTIAPAKPKRVICLALGH